MRSRIRARFTVSGAKPPGCETLDALECGQRCEGTSGWDVITLKLPTGEALKIPGDEARVLARRLWEIAPHPGAAPIAVKIIDAARASDLRLKTVDVSEREYGALRLVLVDQPPLTTP